MNNNLTVKILIFMVAGVVFGLAMKFLSSFGMPGTYFINNVLQLGGKAFISLMQMLVVPIVFVSIVHGITSFEGFGAVGRVGFKSVQWFLITTISATLLALIVANIFSLGSDLYLDVAAKGNIVQNGTPSLWQFVSNIIPDNPIKAMAEGNMLQVIVFAILIGIAINASGENGRRIAAFFSDLNAICTKYIMMLMSIAPYGVFCLIAVLFIEQGFELILGMLDYFLAVLSVLLLHALVTFSIILRISNLSPVVFFSKMYSVMLFVFGISSSNATIPIMLDTVERKLGVSKSIASFVIPFGVNVNKNGTAIMQTIAAIFIAHIYHVPISIIGYFTLVAMVILVSIATAGVPGIGMITLVMILKQLGLPVEGIALILGVDRLLDMVRTAVNVAGNSMIACLVAKSEKQIDYRVYESIIPDKPTI